MHYLRLPCAVLKIVVVKAFSVSTKSLGITSFYSINDEVDDVINKYLEKNTNCVL